MRNTNSILAATAAALILTATAPASEPDFQAPSTARARQSAPLLAQAARAVNRSAPRSGDEHVSNLWVYPTNDADSVVAQYVVVSDKTPAASIQHLELLKIERNRIVERHDLLQPEDCVPRASR